VVALVASFLERSVPRPRTVKLTIMARDPSVTDRRSQDPARQILRARVDVPASRLAPGPRGPRLHVVDFNATTRELTPAIDLTTDATTSPEFGQVDRFVDATDATLLDDPAFRAQSVYAIAARTLAIFEFALGRPVPWAFGASQLYLVPTAFAEANAYYADEDQALYFGYFPGKGRERVLTCLAHDIVVHETTHAILDGLRRRFDVPSMPDQAGFHEGFADVVALLSILAVPESIEVLIGGSDSQTLAADEVSEEHLRRSVLFTIGRQFGDAVHQTRGGGLRRSIEQAPTVAWRDPKKRRWQEPHRRGEILVAAVMQAFLGMWVARLRPITTASVDRGRAAEEGARAARHLLEMCIRAIDYSPPVDFSFDDFLGAMVASDAEISPEDDSGYRPAVIEGFGRFGIVAPEGAAVVIPDAQWPSYRSFSYTALRSDPDEAFRFLWENVELLKIDPRYYLHVENVRPSVRVGPRGFVVAETIVDYVQELILTRAELDELAGSESTDRLAPAEIPPDTQLKLWGGGTIVFDEFGALKYHHAKPLADWPRQIARLRYLVDQGLWDTKRRMGFSYGTSLGQRFAAFHAAGAHADEEW
jgi:hypothetical protein